MNNKDSLFNYYRDHINMFIKDLTTGIRALQNDLTQETKSRAGDKYETLRKMINTEINKLSSQIQQFAVMSQSLAQTGLKTLPKKLS